MRRPCAAPLRGGVPARYARLRSAAKRRSSLKSVTHALRRMCYLCDEDIPTVALPISNESLLVNVRQQSDGAVPKAPRLSETFTLSDASQDWRTCEPKWRGSTALGEGRRGKAQVAYE